MSSEYRNKMQATQSELAPLRGKPIDLRKEHKEFVDSWAGYPDKLPPASQHFAHLEEGSLPAWIRKPQT